MKTAKVISSKIEIVDVARPCLTDKGAIIKVYGCGLCGSDIVKFLEKRENIVLGHEVVGEIVDIKTNTSFKKGDIVALGHHYPCFKCEFCENESYSMCPTFKNTNIFPSGFSEYILITEGHLKNTVFKIPKNLTLEEASFMEPLACCIRAVKRAGKIKTALCLGLGSIGILMTQALENFGIEAYGFDINEERQNNAGKWGIKYNENIKYDAIFMTSGAAGAIKTALELVKSGGKIIVFSSVKTQDGYSNNDIYYRELSIIGSYSPAPCDLELSMEFLKKGKVKTKGMTTTYTLDNLSDAVQDTIDNKIFKGYIQICQK